VVRVDELVGGLLDPRPLPKGHRQQQPGAGNGALVVKGDLDLVQHDLRGRIEKVSSSSRIMAAWQPPLSLVRGPCSQQADHHRASDSVDRG